MVADRPASLTPGQWAYAAFNLVFYPGLLLGLGGDWRWVEGWIFSGWFALSILVSAIFLIRNDPALLKERFKRPGQGQQKGWDRWFIRLTIPLYIGWFVVMPLDSHRHGRDLHFPLAVKIVGGMLLLAALILIMRALADNTFASPLVRIQSERGQHVVTTGVYSAVRHPMYSGALCLFVGAPCLLGSVWGLALGPVLIGLFAARILGEERMLERELEGYGEYRKRVRYRLIPGIW
jgi:protein-S-isoprenylcysteine O-methyltransferase Ste14